MLLRAKRDLRPVQNRERIQERSTIATVRFKYAPLSSKAERTVFMYLGSKRDPYEWDTVYKHHRVLLDGKVLHLSGYDVKHIESVDSI